MHKWYVIGLVLATNISLSAHADAKKLAVDAEVRADYLAHAKVLDPVNLDILPYSDAKTGRPGSVFPADAILECDYHHTGSSGGTTPKFSCEVTSAKDANGNSIPSHHEKIKVRYAGVKQFSTIITTRLAWILGFGSDIETPIQKVICHGCSADPFVSVDETNETHTFSEVSIEKYYPGTLIYTPGQRFHNDDGEGSGAWGWEELPTSPEGDALRLFAAFLKHGDSKSAQNELLCQGTVKNGGCDSPTVYVHDFGNTLGGDGMSIDPLNFKKWSSSAVWKNGTCIAQVKQNWFNGPGLNNPEISEAGRKILADRLQNLLNHPNAIREIFAAAHIEHYSDHGSHHTADEWADAFIAKAQQIIDASCE